jgi:hypothetical protein
MFAVRYRAMSHHLAKYRWNIITYCATLDDDCQNRYLATVSLVLECKHCTSLEVLVVLGEPNPSSSREDASRAYWRNVWRGRYGGNWCPNPHPLHRWHDVASNLAGGVQSSAGYSLPLERKWEAQIQPELDVIPPRRAGVV